VGLLIEVADCVAVVQHNGMCVLPCDRTESRLKTIKTKVKRLTIAAGERRRKRRVKTLSRPLQRRSITFQSSSDVCESLGAAAVC